MAYTTIDDPSAYFQAKTYTGTGSSLAITNDGNSNLQPDWLWIKNRGTVDENVVHDSVRSVGKRLLTDGSQAEATTTNQVTSFDTNGFTVPGGSNNTGASSNNYVAWQWKASGSTTSNTDGTITSTVSANTTAGFSIVSYTGTSSTATVGHGLGVTPSMIIVKNRSAVQNWIVYHQAIGNTGAIYLNASNATNTASGWFNNTSPTSSVFTVGTYDAINGSSHNLIAYCFAEKKGFSKLGTYTGNGSIPNFIYTGFKPAMVIFKSTGADNWCIMDNKRDSFNVMDKRLFPHLSNAESTGVSNVVDFVSNGFCLRTSDSSFNLNGQSFIYMAFAENPFVTSTGIPTTAR